MIQFFGGLILALFMVCINGLVLSYAWAEIFVEFFTMLPKLNPIQCIALSLFTFVLFDKSTASINNDNTEPDMLKIAWSYFWERMFILVLIWLISGVI